MTITTYPSSGDSADLAALSLTRLFARLEHNLLSPTADLKPLRQSEYQRMRVGANIEYARTNLQSLERSLPQIQPLDRRHELQTTLSLKRQILKRLQTVLDELQAEAELRGSSQQGEDDYDDDDEEEEDLLGTPEEGSTTDETPEHIPEEEVVVDSKTTPLPTTSDSHTTQPPPTTLPTEPSAPTPTSPPPPPQLQDQQPPSTLRNRTNAPPTTTATTTSTSLHTHTTSPSPSSTSTSTTKLQATEQTLTTHRAEQEELTTSLLSLATQLKTSSQAFHSSLESEKSVLQRAVDGLDRTTSSMEAAERRMGMLRRMTEGKGWWGRMMLYAWIFGLWLVAVLIVFLGPKLRF